MSPWLAAAVALAAIVVLTWIGMRVKHPEQTADHTDEKEDSTGERFYGTADRPAGPDAEDPIL